MNFRIADTFTDSLAKLTGEEQKAVKTTAFDMQMNPANPGMSFHKLDNARDKHFWSVRVNRDLRLIVHRTSDSLLLCYVDHHDKAYAWAERRKLEVHPKTGAAQLVEVVERIEKITVPRYTYEPAPERMRPALFDHVADGDLLACGVPVDWLPKVRLVGEDGLLELTEHLPQEASEALLELATGGSLSDAQAHIQHLAHDARADSVSDNMMSFLVSEDTRIADQQSGEPPSNASFEHPDAKRRFRTIHHIEELERAFAFPWDKWTIFLHPAQSEWVEKDFNGPARVSGSAGTGKTVVALHRAVHLAREYPEARILLSTFSDTLADALQVKLRRLISDSPRLGERIEVHAMDAVGQRLYEAQFGPAKLATREDVRELLLAVSSDHPEHGFSETFLLSEWEEVVDAWQLTSWEAYRDVQRLGRKTRLPEARRAVLWKLFESLRAKLDEQGWHTHASMFARLTNALSERRHPPYDFAVIDEAQDVNVAQLRFLSALGGDRPNALFFAGDLGQRIFQQPFSWVSQGVEIRGRSRTLHINYRTSHQIRMQADRLLAPEVSDVDGNVEQRKGTVSVFNGPQPEIRSYADAGKEASVVADWLKDRSSEGVALHEIGVFVRSSEEIARAKSALDESGLGYQELEQRTRTKPNQVCLSTMHLAKGLEFRAVVVMACDDEVIPLQSRLESVADEADLEEVYNTERHLLYVACTRARDQLLVTGVDPVSEFLDDLVSR